MPDSWSFAPTPRPASSPRTGGPPPPVNELHLQPGVVTYAYDEEGNMGIAGDQSNILSAPTPPATEPPPEEYTTGGKTIAQVQADVTGGVVTAAAAKASEETQPVPRVTLLTWLDEQIAAA